VQSQLLKAMDAVETSLAEGVKQMTGGLPPWNDEVFNKKAAEMVVDATKALLSERGKTHGDYSRHAAITQDLKRCLQFWLNKRGEDGQPDLSDEAKETLDMIAHKIGRVIAGQWDHPDHWRDIAGYASLVIEDK